MDVVVKLAISPLSCCESSSVMGYSRIENFQDFGHPFGWASLYENLWKLHKTLPRERLSITYRTKYKEYLHASSTVAFWMSPNLFNSFRG